MPYSIDIIRQGQPIELAEWQAYWQRQPDLAGKDFAEASLPGGGVLRMPTPDGVEWRGHPDGIPFIFQWNPRRGKIVLDNPDGAVIEKARQIAAALNAALVGEEGEIY